MRLTAVALLAAVAPAVPAEARDAGPHDHDARECLDRLVTTTLGLDA